MLRGAGKAAGGPLTALPGEDSWRKLVKLLVAPTPKSRRELENETRFPHRPRGQGAAPGTSPFAVDLRRAVSRTQFRDHDQRRTVTLSASLPPRPPGPLCSHSQASAGLAEAGEGWLGLLPSQQFGPGCTAEPAREQWFCRRCQGRMESRQRSA